MPPPSREFAADAAISHALLTAALGVRLRVETEPLRTVRHEWFDTFDWRLDRAGLILERASGPHGDRTHLLLRDSSGELLLLAPAPPAVITASGGPEAFLLEALVPAGPAGPVEPLHPTRMATVIAPASRAQNRVVG